jgi:hypothetical protein
MRLARRREVARRAQHGTLLALILACNWMKATALTVQCSKALKLAELARSYGVTLRSPVIDLIDGWGSMQSHCISVMQNTRSWPDDLAVAVQVRLPDHLLHLLPGPSASRAEVDHHITWRSCWKILSDPTRQRQDYREPIERGGGPHVSEERVRYVATLPSSPSRPLQYWKRPLSTGCTLFPSTGRISHPIPLTHAPIQFGPFHFSAHKDP